MTTIAGAFALASIGCGDSVAATDAGTGGLTGGASSASASVSASATHDVSTSTGGDGGTSGGGDTVIFDVGSNQDVALTDTGPGVDICKVHDDGAGVGPCEEQAPAVAFDPDVQWTWTGPDDEIHSITTPLVLNMTDDNADGEIDLCDIPDVIVLAGPQQAAGVGHIYVLSGDTGELHFKIDTDLVVDLNPAVGDIDNDGLPEIVAGRFKGMLEADLVAFEHDGTLKWTGAPTGSYGDCVALADIDNDGDVEIIAGDSVYDHTGAALFVVEGTSSWSANTAADLDGDGDLEVISGVGAHHPDGSIYFLNEDMPAGYPQVANLDDDPDPEILLTNLEGFSILEHDGALKLGPLTPTGDPPDGKNWERPATIHDFDGDGLPEFATSSASNYATYTRAGALIWKAPVYEPSGIASGTAFDFLGDGTAEAMYADETTLYIFGETGQVLLSTPRKSVTLTEYPIVADIDNDGSSEIVVTSNGYFNPAPTVQVIRDKDDRWIQARRVWNQHTYHVTNVREDGTIPQFEPPSWQHFNTFRTNAQIEGGQACLPEPPG